VERRWGEVGWYRVSEVGEVGGGRAPSQVRRGNAGRGERRPWEEEGPGTPPTTPGAMLGGRREEERVRRERRREHDS